jgi:hypothetical protein
LLLLWVDLVTIMGVRSEAAVGHVLEQLVIELRFGEFLLLKEDETEYILFLL